MSDDTSVIFAAVGFEDEIPVQFWAITPITKSNNTLKNANFFMVVKIMYMVM